MRLALALWTLLLAAAAAPSLSPAAPAKKQAARARGARVACRSTLERSSGALSSFRSLRAACAAPLTPPGLAPVSAALPAPRPSLRLVTPNGGVRAVSLAPSLARGRAPPSAA